MYEAYLGTIVAWAPNFAPAGWMFCQGQTLQVSANQALFALLGTTYGGNSTAFKLPNLSGRFPLGAGVGITGNHNYTLGAGGGTESVILSNSQLPTHTHAASLSGATATLAGASISNGTLTNTAITGSLQAVNGPGSSLIPTAGLTMATVTDPNGAGYETNIYGPPSGGTAVDLGSLKGTVTGTVTGNVTGTVSLSGGNITVGNSGASAAVATLPPYLTLNYIICIQGLWPPRN